MSQIDYEIQKIIDDNIIFHGDAQIDFEGMIKDLKNYFAAQTAQNSEPAEVRAKAEDKERKVKITDKNDEKLEFGSRYKTPCSSKIFQLRQDETGTLYLQDIETGMDYALDDFIAEDDGETFLDIYKVQI